MWCRYGQERPVLPCCAHQNLGSESGWRRLTVPRIPRRRCDTCGDIAACHLAGGGWNCSKCALARVVTGSLADALEMMAEIAGEGPGATKNLAQALRRGAANAFWGGMLLYMADKIEVKVAEQGSQGIENGGATKEEG